MLPPIFSPPDSSTCALPDTQALRCTGVAPMDGLMSADSFTRRTVTTVPSDSVLVISPPGSGTKVSALAAPADSMPKATDAAASTPAVRMEFLPMFMVGASPPGSSSSAAAPVAPGGRDCLVRQRSRHEPARAATAGATAPDQPMLNGAP